MCGIKRKRDGGFDRYCCHGGRVLCLKERKEKKCVFVNVTMMYDPEER